MTSSTMKIEESTAVDGPVGSKGERDFVARHNAEWLIANNGCRNRVHAGAAKISNKSRRVA